MATFEAQLPDSSSEQPAWTQEEAISFEAAQELLNRVHGHLLSEAREAGESDVLSQEVEHIQGLIRTLDPHDQSGITHIRKFYGPVVRSYHEQNETHGSTES